MLGWMKTKALVCIPIIINREGKEEAHNTSYTLHACTIIYNTTIYAQKLYIYVQGMLE